MQKKAIVFDVEGVMFEKNEPIHETIKLIKDFSDTYLFFTNTSLSESKLKRIFNSLLLEKYFLELFTYDTGTKLENIQKIMFQYDLEPENILFIDDLQYNIDSVKPSWVHTLLFNTDCVDLEQSVKDIFWK